MELETLDCRGLRCPLPIIKSAEYLKDKPIGFTFILLSDDPATAPDLIAWSRMSGNPGPLSLTDKSVSSSLCEMVTVIGVPAGVCARINPLQ